MVIVRCIRMDRALPAISVFVTAKLAASFCEPPPFDLATVVDESIRVLEAIHSRELI